MSEIVRIAVDKDVRTKAKTKASSKDLQLKDYIRELVDRDTGDESDE